MCSSYKKIILTIIIESVLKERENCFIFMSDFCWVQKYTSDFLYKHFFKIHVFLVLFYRFNFEILFLYGFIFWHKIKTNHSNTCVEMSFVIFYGVEKIFFPILFALCQYLNYLIMNFILKIYWIDFLIFWTPFCLGIICRPAILCIPYVLFLFYVPFLPAQDHNTFYSHARSFFKCVIFTTLTILLSQVCVQIVLYANSLDSLASFGAWGIFLQNMGFVELHKLE